LYVKESCGYAKRKKKWTSVQSKVKNKKKKREKKK
jgi:hypothetical protein